MNFPVKEARRLNKNCVKFLAKCKKKEHKGRYLDESARKSDKHKIKRSNGFLKFQGSRLTLYA